MSDKSHILTIGYGNRDFDVFLSLIEQNGVDVICDVRSSPYSARFVNFNREALNISLRGARIKYLFLGDLLGARPSDPDLYDSGRASYEAMAASSQFRSGIERLEIGMQSYRIALMCAEKDPIDCHRAILIAPHLRNDGVRVDHIAANGEIEKDDELRARVVSRYGLEQASLFESDGRPDVVLEAYRKRGDELAYNIDAAYRARSRS